MRFSFLPPPSPSSLSSLPLASSQFDGPLLLPRSAPSECLVESDWFSPLAACFAARSLSELSSSDSVSSPFFFGGGGELNCSRLASMPHARHWNLLLISSSPLKRFLAFLSSWISHQRVTFSPSLGCSACNRPPARLILYSVSSIGFIQIFINNWALCCNSLRTVWFRDFGDSVAMMSGDTPAPAARLELTSWWCGLVKCGRPRGSLGRSEGGVLLSFPWEQCVLFLRFRV